VLCAFVCVVFSRAAIFVRSDLRVFRRDGLEGCNDDVHTPVEGWWGCRASFASAFAFLSSSKPAPGNQSASSPKVGSISL
jgi:hypothetical protein